MSNSVVRMTRAPGQPFRDRHLVGGGNHKAVLAVLDAVGGAGVFGGQHREAMRERVRDHLAESVAERRQDQQAGVEYTWPSVLAGTEP